MKVRAQEEREAAYSVKLRSFTQLLKPGMTRKEVEGYLRTKNLDFQQMCCVDHSEMGSRSSWDDLTKIGEESPPWFCGEKNVYVAFQFTDHARRDGVAKADDADMLRRVSIYRWLERCL